MAFPDHGDPDFQTKLNSLQEFQYFQVPETLPVGTVEDYDKRTKNACSGIEKTLYQHLMQHYLSYRSPYRGLLLYHGLGVGKTCSSITVAEALLHDHSSREQPRIWVILPSALQKSYEDQICNVAMMADPRQCTGDKYRRMVHGTSDPAALTKKVKALIKSRYEMFTYDGFASEIEKLRRTLTPEKYRQHISNKVIIVDEAHNLRIEETDKRAAQALMDVARDGNNNRLVLLSATPMYNEPSEVFWLLSLLCENDKRPNVLKKLPALYNTKGDANEDAFSLLKQLSSEYVSYIKGTNPFTYAARLSPRDSGVPILATATGWEKVIRDGLVPTNCSPFQKTSIATMKKSDAIHHQALNICYPSSADSSKAKVGETGFFSVFQREQQEDPILVSYINPAEKPLFPGEDKLAKIAPKIQRICDLIRNSEGIVVIYSQYIWSGVIPVAIALEHMGFQRFGGKNLMKNPDIVQNPVRYPGIPFPSYCILSGYPSVMGSSKIEELLKSINSPKNKHGETIKVVLMSPVAGEGLSLRNVREVHILDPWYHLNRLEQVIGRAFRTCHHNTLPVEERNVTVFIHVSTDPDPAVDTTDINSYQIAARKAKEMDDVERVIRDSAMDCSLFKNVNYFPQSLFQFDVLMRSSRGITVPFRFGDDLAKQPKCADLIGNPDRTSVRKDVYRELIPTGISRLKRYISSRPVEQIYFQKDELSSAIAMHPDITESVLIEATKPGNSIHLYHHKSQYVLRKPTGKHHPLHLSIVGKVQQQQHSAPSEADNNCESVVSAQSVADSLVGKLLIYKAINSQCWSAFAKKIIGYGQNIPENILKHVQLLADEGAFVTATEIPRYRNPTKNPYIGFVDIFDTSNSFKVTLYDHDRSMFREATDVEVNSIKSARIDESPKNKDVVFAIMEPHLYKKKFDVPVTNEIKVFIPRVTGTSQKGIVCESMKKNDTLGFLNQLGVTSASGTKEQVCFTFAVELLKQKRLHFLPHLKPKKV